MFDKFLMSEYVALLQMQQIELKYSFCSNDFPSVRANRVFVFLSLIDSSFHA